MIHTQLQKLRESKELSKAEIARILDIPYTTYMGYENGTREPNSKMLVSFSNYYNVSVDYILGNEKKEIQDFKVNIKEQKIIQKYRKLDDHSKIVVDTVLQLEYNRNHSDYLAKPDSIINPNIIELPIYDDIRASAGLGNYLDGSIKPIIKVFNLNSKTTCADHAISVNGSSMEPLIADDEIIFIKEQPSVENGEIGIFVYDGEIYCKRLILDGKKVILRSENKKYSDIIVNPNLELTTIGKVLL